MITAPPQMNSNMAILLPSDHARTGHGPSRCPCDGSLFHIDNNP